MSVSTITQSLSSAANTVLNGLISSIQWLGHQISVLSNAVFGFASAFASAAFVKGAALAKATWSFASAAVVKGASLAQTAWTLAQPLLVRAAAVVFSSYGVFAGAAALAGVCYWSHKKGDPAEHHHILRNVGIASALVALGLFSVGGYNVLFPSVS